MPGYAAGYGPGPARGPGPGARAGEGRSYPYASTPGYDNPRDHVQWRGGQSSAADTAMPPRFPPGAVPPGAVPPGAVPPGAAHGGRQGPPDGRAGQKGPAATYPYSEAGAYAGPEAYRKPVNGGTYAYVIRDNDEIPHSPAPSQPTAPTANQGHGPARRSHHDRQSRTEPLSLGPPPALPASPAPAGVPGIAAQAGYSEPRSDDSAAAYGPDDPAYGPPGRDWYERAESEADRWQESEEELRQARGPFEPLPPDHEVRTPPPPDFEAAASAANVTSAASAAGVTSAASVADTARAGAHAGVGDASFQRSGGPPADPQADRQAGRQADRPADPDIDPRDDDLDVALVGQGAGPLERIKDLYTTAEAIGERRLDRHFEQLLERQRQLISDYFTNQEFRRPADAGPAGAGPVSAGPAGSGPAGAGPAATSHGPKPSAPADRPADADDPAGWAGPRNERMPFDTARRSPR